MVLRALIFDVDGTLAETEEAHRQAFNETFAAHGVNAQWPDHARQWQWDQPTYRRLLKTTGGKERIAAYLRDDLGHNPEEWTTRIADLHRAKTKRYVDLLAEGGLDLRPGIRMLMDEARARGLKLAIATTTSRPNVDALCEACFAARSDDLFDVIAAGDEVPRKKPAPDVYELALERLGLLPADCIALEDSINGLRSAKAAGLACIVSPSVYTIEEDHAGADLIIGSFADLRFSEDGIGAAAE